MELFEYIATHRTQPNLGIAKSLGASEELLEYLRNTPWNTNLNVIGSLGSGGDDDQGEVWFTGTINLNVGCVTEETVAYRGVELSPTEIANAEALWDSPNGYDISVNDVSLSLIIDYDYMKAWAVGESSLSYEVPLFNVVRREETEKLVAVGVPCDWTGDVEVTVAHK